MLLAGRAGPGRAPGRRPWPRQVPETQRATWRRSRPRERGGVEVAAQVVRGFGGPEAGVFDAFLADRVGEGVGAAVRDGGVLAAVEGVPAEGGEDGADALRVEHVYRAAAGADAGGELEHIVFGGGGQHRARVVQDDPGQPAGLACAGRAECAQCVLEPPARATDMPAPAAIRVPWLVDVGDPVRLAVGVGAVAAQDGLRAARTASLSATSLCSSYKRRSAQLRLPAMTGRSTRRDEGCAIMT